MTWTMGDTANVEAMRTTGIVEMAAPVLRHARTAMSATPIAVMAMPTVEAMLELIVTTDAMDLTVVVHRHHATTMTIAPVGHAPAHRPRPHAIVTAATIANPTFATTRLVRTTGDRLRPVVHRRPGPRLCLQKSRLLAAKLSKSVSLRCSPRQTR